MARIIVAEDNPGLSRVICFNLQRAGHEVFAAANGRIAWEEALGSKYDIILSDQQMPEMSGVELASKLRASDDYRTVPILMLTAKGLELELAALRDELHISDVFIKPFSPREVVAKVEELLQPA